MGEIGFVGYDDAGHFVHNCAVCGGDAPFGYGYFPQRVTAAKPDGELGTWFCNVHNPNPMNRRQAQAWLCHCGDHWWTNLTKGFVTMVSPQDAELVQEQVWTALIRQSMSVIYAKRGLPGNKSICLHQEILPGAVQVDHENRNGLDNRRENLRRADARLNNANRGKPVTPNQSSSFKGVSYIADRPLSKPWCVKCDRKHVGYFATEAEAAVAYNKAAIERYGEFAEINFIGEPAPLDDLEACHVERDHEGLPLGPLARAARLRGFEW